MSAILGLHYFDQRPVTSEELMRMSAPLAAHGPDRVGYWQEGAIGLAQRQMIITPEDRYERQPVTSADGQLVLISDARVDNRPELIDELRIPVAEANRVPDSALILQAYERWEEDAPKRLLGDYAFAVWDKRQHRLYLTRSPLGNRPLYYVHTEQCFAFATMPSGLFALPWVPRILALEHALDPAPDHTLYRDVQKVPAGHWLMVSQSGLRQERFWQLDLDRRLHLRYDEAYVEAFNELFTRAVQRRLRTLYPIGVAMSGGLDSSSVAVTTARLLAEQGKELSAFTEVPRAHFDAPLPPGKYADETPFVQAIAALYPNLHLNLVRTDGRGPFHELDRFFDAMYAPFQNVSNRVWIEALQEQAQSRGVRVLLTGASGNLTVSWPGTHPLPALLRQGSWQQAWHNMYAQTRNPITAARIAAGQGLLPLLPSHLQAVVHHLRHASLRDCLAAWTFPAVLQPEWIQARHRRRWIAQRFPVAGTERELRHAALLRAVNSDYDAAYAARFGISWCDPTADLQLVEFCFAVPEAQWRQGKESRSLIRRAMAGRLPESVLHNPKRGMQAADWYERLLAQRGELQADLERLAQNATVQRYLDLPRLRQLADRLPETGWDKPGMFTDYHWSLLGGLMVGRFILWFEANQAEQVTP